jgi:hypothetical protein
LSGAKSSTEFSAHSELTGGILSNAKQSFPEGIIST